MTIHRRPKIPNINENSLDRTLQKVLFINKTHQSPPIAQLTLIILLDALNEIGLEAFCCIKPRQTPGFAVVRLPGQAIKLHLFSIQFLLIVQTLYQIVNISIKVFL